MATDPQFASTVKAGAAIPAGAETSLTVPTLAAVVLTAGTSGSKIEEVIVEAVTTSLTPTTVAGLVYLFLFDATTYHLFDTVSVAAVTASATVPPFRANKPYTNLLLPAGWSLRASQSVAGNANLLKVTALGGDF